MPKFNANLSMMFQEFDFLGRFSQARSAGFTGVEVLFPYDFEPDTIRNNLEQHALELVLMNAPPGNFDAGDRGLACIPTRTGEFQDSIDTAIRYATALDCRRLHCMAGLKPQHVPTEVAEQTFIHNIQFAADQAISHGIDIMVEPINIRDMPNYFLNYSSQATDLIKRIDRQNVKLQYDIYHMQIMEGDLAHTIQSLLPMIGHMQLADTPGRHEPGTGEINYSFLFDHIDRCGYQGWIGCEYRPKNDTASGLNWIKPHLN